MTGYYEKKFIHLRRNFIVLFIPRTFKYNEYVINMYKDMTLIYLIYQITLYSRFTLFW